MKKNKYSQLVVVLSIFLLVAVACAKSSTATNTINDATGNNLTDTTENTENSNQNSENTSTIDNDNDTDNTSTEENITLENNNDEEQNNSQELSDKNNNISEQTNSSDSSGNNSSNNANSNEITVDTSINNNNSSSNNNNSNITVEEPENEKPIWPNSDGIYAIGDNYFKSIYPLNEKSVKKAADYINNIKQTYLSNNTNIYYAIIPDKTYYAKDSGYDTLDYDRMMEILKQNITDISCIELKDLLSLDDYYKTDNHWRQEKIIDIANRIGKSLGFKIDESSFETKSYKTFTGMYSKYVTDKLFNESISYLVNDAITNASVDNYQNKNFTKVYDTDKLTTNNSYDMFLSGASPFITITNSSSTNDKELVIFRDSFTSSLAPLIISEYSKITLIDTRYMSNILLKDFIEFNNQDILFLYSSAVINNSAMLK